jgi:uncharacterized protein
MNIQNFSMIPAAYLNPTAYGDLAGLNKWVWITGHVFADMKFMTIFSMLFGAGIVLFTEKALEKRGKSAGLHYRRTFWLLIIGLAHAHIIWSGDILVPYALCALLVFLFRKMKPKPLLIFGLILILIHTIIYSFFGMTLSFWPEESIQQTMLGWVPGQEAITAEINAITGPWAEQIAHTSNQAIFFETGVFFMIFIWRAGGLMLVGMALYKWGVLSAKRSTKFYRNGWLISWIAGLPLVIYGITWNFNNNWELSSMFIGSQYNYIGSLGVSFGFICMIMLIVKSSAFNWIKDRLAAVGQMALTNYLMQSIIGTMIFFGIGLSLYGTIDRTGQLLIVFAIWIAQVLWSKPCSTGLFLDHLSGYGVP